MATRNIIEKLFSEDNKHTTANVIDINNTSSVARGEDKGALAHTPSSANEVPEVTSIRDKQGVSEVSLNAKSQDPDEASFEITKAYSLELSLISWFLPSPQTLLPLGSLVILIGVRTWTL